MAVIPVRCPECNKKIELDESWINQDVQCRHCGETFLFSQYLVPEGYTESIKKRKIYLLLAIGLVFTGICIFFGLKIGAKKRERRELQEQRARRIAYMTRRNSNQENIENYISSGNSEPHTQFRSQKDLENYIQTSNQSPNIIIREALHNYNQMVQSDIRMEKSLKEMLEKRFRMDLDPAETAISDFKYEVQEKIKTEFPFSISEYTREMEERAKEKYPMAKIGTVIEIKSLRDGRLKGILNGYTANRSSIYLDGKKYSISDLTQSSGILVDNDLNRQARKRFAEEKCSEYQTKMQISAQNSLKELMGNKGYIQANNQFYSPSEYLELLKSGNSGRSYRNRHYSSNSKSNRKRQRRYKQNSSAKKYSNSPTNSSGAQNLSIPSRSSRFTEHIQYYSYPNSPSDSSKKKRVRKTF